MAHVVTGTKNLDVRFGDFGLLGELGTQHVLGQSEVAVIYPAYESQSKHVLATEYALVVQSAILERLLTQRCNRARNDFACYSQFCDRVFGLELGFLKVLSGERVDVDDYCTGRLAELVLRLQCRRVHRDKYVAFVTRCEYLVGSDVYLESRYSGKHSLRSTYVGGVVGEGADVISHCCRNCGKDVSGQLHAVSGVSGEAYDNLVQFLFFFCVCHVMVFYNFFLLPFGAF